MTTRLRHVAIASADPDNSVGFFTDVLGWTVAGKIDSRNARGYYVTDPYYYGLRPAPRGYRYVYAGNDILLIAVASGLIASVLSDIY